MNKQKLNSLSNLRDLIANNPKAKIRIEIKNTEEKIRNEDRQLPLKQSGSIEEVKLKYSF